MVYRDPSYKPTYKTVCEGDGYTEAIKIEFQPDLVSYNALLRVFFRDCPADSYTLPDQYKDVIWVHDSAQRELALAMAKRRGKAVKLMIRPAQPWYDAEE